MKLAQQDLVHPPPAPGSSAGRARRTRARCAPDSLASSALAGWIRSPRAASTRVTGCWASQSISQVGMQAAQLVGDRDVAPGVAQPDRRGDEQRPPGSAPARAHRRGDAGAAAGGATRSTNSRSSRLTRTGSRASGRWPAPSSIDQLAAGAPRASGARVGQRRDRVVVAVDHQHRAAHARAGSARTRSRSTTCRDVGATSSPASVSRPQATQSSTGLVECGSGKHIAKKNSRKSS